MTGVGPKRYLIRLRWERGAYVSSTMPQAEAEKKAAELEAAVFGCGDGPGFVQMVGHDGRTIRVRGREVIGIECNPHSEDVEQSPTPGNRPVTGVAIHTSGGVFSASTPAGTDFLRRQAGRVPQGSQR